MGSNKPVDASRISQLLEIRRSITVDSSQSTASRLGSSLRRTSRKFMRRAANKVRRVSSTITTMVSAEEEQCLPSVAVFHPYSGPRMVWDLTIIMLILYTAIGVPLRLSWSLKETMAVWILDRLLDLLFMVDIAINLNTAFERGTELIVDRRSIVKHYLATWFALDFIASFPFDFIFSFLAGADANSLSMLPRLVRLLKLSRLFRLARLQRILRRVQLQMGIRNSTNKILKFSGAAILCAHWMACMFYATSTLTGALGGGDAFPSWVERLAEDKNQLDADSVSHTYVASLYWSLTTMTSIGYGDVAPKTPSERLFGIFGMILGAVLFGHFMGNVLAVVADMSPAENEFHLKMDMLNVYMREQNLNTELRRQIEEFYHIEHKLTNHQVDEAEMLRELPGRLKRELSLAISKRILGHVPLFEGMSSSFVRTVGLAMERKVYPQGEKVILEGDVVTNFYIVTAGRANLERQGAVVGALRNGDYFGSIPISLDSMDSARSVSSYTVRTAEWTEVRSLSIARFRQLIGQFPAAKHALVQRIVDNILEQNKLEHSKLHAKHEVVSLHEVEANAVADASIDRQQLHHFVENALSQHTESPRRHSKLGRCSLIPELRPESADDSLLKDLRQFELQRTAAKRQQQTMLGKLEQELVPFDSLMALLSLMTEANTSAGDSHKALAEYMQCIGDNGLLKRMVQLRKLIHYFVVEQPSECVDDDEEKEEDEETRIGARMNAFFKPFMFVQAPESIAEAVAKQSSKVLYHGVDAECHEATELTLFRLGYTPTFSSSCKELETLAVQNAFDVVMIDCDDIREIESTLKLIATEATSLVCLVSNCVQHKKLMKLSAEHGVHVVLRKPLILQDLRQMLKQVGLAM